MSGPKVDYVEIEKQKKLALERERQARLEKIREATSLMRLAQNDCRDKVGLVLKHNMQLIESVREYEQMRLTLQRIQNIKTLYVKRLNELCQIAVPKNNEEISSTTKYISGESCSIYEAYQHEVRKEFDRINQFLNSSRKQKQYIDFSNQLNAVTRDEKVKTVSLSFGNLTAPESRSNNTKEISFDIQEIQAEIVCLVSTDGINEHDRQQLMSFEQRIQKVNQNVDELCTAVEEYKIARVRIQQEIEAFETLYEEYTAEYYSLQSFDGAEKMSQPKRRSDFNSVNDLIEELHSTQKKARQQNEQKYIREQINEVMKLFGHDLCEDIVLSDEQKGKHYLCKSKKEDTAIHIHVSETNQIMMEVVGVEDSVEEPKTNGINASLHNANSDIEADYLLEEQGRFCKMHPLIVQELEKRGVVMSEKVHQKPDKKYCKVIGQMRGDHVADESKAQVSRIVKLDSQKIMELKERKS